VRTSSGVAAISTSIRIVMVQWYKMQQYLEMSLAAMAFYQDFVVMSAATI
jgi:hypothetical protein